jgi:hypothetical protein
METKTFIPNPDLKSLEKLVGTWKLGGDTSGTVIYEWMEGGFFLIQHIDMHLFGNHIRSIEIIGHWQPFGEAPDKEIRSRSYDNSGNTLDYVYDLKEDTLTIWGGEKGSPSYFKGMFSKDCKVNSGEWVYPGGGYKSTMTKIK